MEWELARVMVEGPCQAEELEQRAAALLGRKYAFLKPLARRIVNFFGSQRRLREGPLWDFLCQDRGLQRALESRRISTHHLRQPAATMVPNAGPPTTWQLPSLCSSSQLAEWLQLSPRQLHWMVDRAGRERTAPQGKLRHYHYRWLAKRRFGSARLIEIPKSRMRSVQRRILAGVLNKIPPHNGAHGFVAGRSTSTFAQPHAGRAVVVKMDLRDFFPSLSRRRVFAIFQAAGYPSAVAQQLASLCTNQASEDVWDSFPGFGNGPADTWYHQQLYRSPHLPQGSPTSPALSNLCCFRLDCRMAGLATSIGACYTRYADDMVFSGGPELRRAARRLIATASAIAVDEGLRVQTRKTKVMTRGGRQRVGGLVVNDCPRLGRNQYDGLRALLYNCARHGPSSQNRDGHPDFRAHLLGKISYVTSVEPLRGQRLRAVFDAIDWPS